MILFLLQSKEVLEFAKKKYYGVNRFEQVISVLLYEKLASFCR